MKILLRILLAASLASVAPTHLAPAFAQPKKVVASPALQKEFDGFIAKFRAALKANDAVAVAALTQLPYPADRTISDAAQFQAKIYKSYFGAKVRACLQRSKAVYERDGLNNDNYFIFCGEDIFTFTKTPSGFLFTDIGMND